VDLEKRLGAFSVAARFASDAGVTALFGRSGSGKTTLLNLIAGLLPPDRGRVAVDGTVFLDSARGIELPAHRRRIGYVFQEGRLLPHLTVRQNLLYGRFFTPRAERYETLERVVALLDIGHLLERRPHRLSGGEKQRVAIGRALLASPRILLLDEPLAALDQARKSEILYYIERLRDEVRIPIVYVSHALEEVVRLADTLVLVSGGGVTEAGPVAELAARLDLRPQLGRFEAGAVIECRVAEQDLASGLARLEFAGGALYAPDVDALVGERLRVRIRARDVSLALSAPRDASFLNVVAGTVAAIGGEPGATVDVRLDAAGAPLVARITRKSVAALGLAPGKPVYALIKAVAIDRHSVGYA
ncbi:MAG: molybdenum ABC transporter ATP-binding protein, partial [Betaproteobacteria bacterium]|nr:molybdenum ABC transporter ATP-binding protein [Betaproteobacteria bacterium]